MRAYSTRMSCRSICSFGHFVSNLGQSVSTYNHGQKSWDKLAFVVLFHMRQTNLSTLVQPLPPPPYNVEHMYTLFFQSFDIVLGGGGGGEQRILKRITVLF